MTKKHLDPLNVVNHEHYLLKFQRFVVNVYCYCVPVFKKEFYTEKVKIMQNPTQINPLYPFLLIHKYFIHISNTKSESII